MLQSNEIENPKKRKEKKRNQKKRKPITQMNFTTKYTPQKGSFGKTGNPP